MFSVSWLRLLPNRLFAGVFTLCLLVLVGPFRPLSVRSLTGLFCLLCMFFPCFDYVVFTFLILVVWLCGYACWLVPSFCYNLFRFLFFCACSCCFDIDIVFVCLCCFSLQVLFSFSISSRIRFVCFSLGFVDVQEY